MSTRHKSWSEKMAEARERRKPKPKARRPTAYGSVVGDVFDVVGQLAGVTNDWTGSGKKKRRK